MARRASTFPPPPPQRAAGWALWAAFALATAAWSCFSPDPTEGLECTPEGTCPEGQTCASDNRCYSPGNEPPCTPTFEPVAALTPNAADRPEIFGKRLALHGDTLVVGDELGDGLSMDEGEARVFSIADDGPVLTQRLTNDQGTSFDEFGMDVAVRDREFLVVGVPYATPLPLGGEATGIAYVFEFDGTTYGNPLQLAGSAPTPTSQVPKSDRAPFGAMVAATSDLVAVGSRADDQVYVFEKMGATWTEVASLPVMGLASGRTYGGGGLILTPDTLMVGAPESRDKAGAALGAVVVYQRQGGTWQPVQTLQPASLRNLGEFGWSLAADLEAGILVVGARTDSTASAGDGGSVYVFELEAGQWQETARLSDPEPDGAGCFGEAVAIDGDTIVVGAPRCEDDVRALAGSAYVFTRGNGGWVPGAVPSPATREGDGFGTAVALQDDLLVVSAPAPFDSIHGGTVHVYARTACE